VSPWLELQGDDRRVLELPEVGTLIVGSSPERAGFVVSGQGVDEAHCAIGRTRDGDWAIKDLGSRHGTLVNGQRVSAARLSDGDEIVLGSRRVALRSQRPASAPARQVQAPRITGYRIERLIGRGGMGTVWLAVQESLRRPVALKVLSPRLASDQDFVQRFQAEARAAAALSHANVVVVYDVGEDGGTHYLSMEFMAGGSLEQKLQGHGPLSWKGVLSVLADAATGLAYAESRGIVHRDIKPANLMYSGTGTVKIADLGLATTIEREASEAEGGRKVYGTPHFISPEQARGEAVDNRSDLYSLGATAYRLLTGHTPFEGESTRDILRALQSEDPQPLREHVPDLPPDLEALVTRLMAKVPQQRFPSAEALRRECERLRLLAEHGPTLEAQGGSRAQRWIGLVLLLVVVASGVAWFLLRESSTDPGPPSVASNPMLGETPDPLGDDPEFFTPVETAPQPTNEERELRERERAARFELDALSPLLTPEDRRDALAGVATRWAGTEAGREARQRLEEIDRLAAEEATRTPAPDPLAAARAEALAQAGWPPAGEGVPAVGRALAALAVYEPSGALAESFAPVRAQLMDEVARSATATIEAHFTRADEAAAGGDFAAVRATLGALEGLFEGFSAPADEAEDVPESLRELARREALWRERTARVDDDERAWLAAVERAERIALAGALGPDSDLLKEIVTADWDAVDARLAALQAPLAEREPARRLRERAARARAALTTLADEFQAGHWRRRSVLDPRSRRVREVRDVRPSGLLFDDDTQPEPWGRAAGDPDWWQQLFQARVESDWTPDQVRAIVALLGLEGAARAATLARKALDRGLLDPEDLQHLEGALGAALAWQAQLGEADPELEAEAAAARLLARAIGASQRNEWSRAAADLERCLEEADGTVLLALVSGGTAWRAASSSGEAR
jgi:serine/threonine protein kinase